jgi:dipeptidyl aminopeptidase/acylaminoacyl peptidase
MTYAHQIRTPTLILSNVGDDSVPITESYKLFHALKDNRVEVTFIAYPVNGHRPSDGMHERDEARRWGEWTADHFKRVGGG